MIKFLLSSYIILRLGQEFQEIQLHSTNGILLFLFHLISRNSFIQIRTLYFLLFKYFFQLLLFHLDATELITVDCLLIVSVEIGCIHLAFSAFRFPCQALPFEAQKSELLLSNNSLS